MATYDPQRSRSRQRATDDQPAAVDALLGTVTAPPGSDLEPGPRRAAGPESPAETEVPRVVDLDGPAPATDAVEGRAGAVRLLLAGAIVALLAAVVLVVRRRRRQPAGDSSAVS